MFRVTDLRHIPRVLQYISAIEPVTKRPPVLRDHFLMANRVVFQDRLYCIGKSDHL